MAQYQHSGAGRLISFYAPLGIGLIYYGVLCFVYLATPYSLQGHIGTSVDRTCMVPVMLFVQVWSIG